MMCFSLRGNRGSLKEKTKQLSLGRSLTLTLSASLIMWWRSPIHQQSLLSLAGVPFLKQGVLEGFQKGLKSQRFPLLRSWTGHQELGLWVSYMEQLQGTHHPFPKDDSSAEEDAGSNPGWAGWSEGLACRPGRLQRRTTVLYQFPLKSSFSMGAAWIWRGKGQRGWKRKSEGNSLWELG